MVRAAATLGMAGTLQIRAGRPYLNGCPLADGCHELLRRVSAARVLVDGRWRQDVVAYTPVRLWVHGDRLKVVAGDGAAGPPRPGDLFVPVPR